MKSLKPAIRVFLLDSVIIMLLLAGCSQNADPKSSPTTAAPPSQEQLQKIIDDAAVTTNRVGTYKVDLSLSAAISVNTGDFVRGGSSNAITRATVFTSIQSETDRSARMSHAKYHLSTTVEGRTPNTENSVEMFYAFPDFMYAKLTTQWTKQPYREDALAPGSKELDEQLTLLKSATDLRFSRYEALEGADNYVVELTLDPLKATSWFLKKMIFGSESQPENEVKNLKSLTCSVWIGKSTLLLNKVDLAYSWQNNGSDNTEVSAAVKIYDYNQPLNLAPPTDVIVIPPLPASPGPQK